MNSVAPGLIATEAKILAHTSLGRIGLPETSAESRRASRRMIPHGVLAWINHWKDAKRLRQYMEIDLYWQGASGATNKHKHGYRVGEIRWGDGLPPPKKKRLGKIFLRRALKGC